MTLRVFPVSNVPGVHFSNDFGFERGTPDKPRPHQGVDIFAPEGTPALAVDDGAVSYEVDPIGGLSFYLRTADGITYYGTHLSRVEGRARMVRAGDVIAYVGHDGNAAATPPHLHFEVHPRGGVMNPFPLLQSAERRTVAPSSRALAWTIALGAAGFAWYRYAGGDRVVSSLASGARRLLPRS